MKFVKNLLASANKQLLKSSLPILYSLFILFLPSCVVNDPLVRDEKNTMQENSFATLSFLNGLHDLNERFSANTKANSLDDYENEELLSEMTILSKTYLDVFEIEYSDYLSATDPKLVILALFMAEYNLAPDESSLDTLWSCLSSSIGFDDIIFILSGEGLSKQALSTAAGKAMAKRIGKKAAVKLLSKAIPAAAILIDVTDVIICMSNSYGFQNINSILDTTRVNESVTIDPEE